MSIGSEAREAVGSNEASPTNVRWLIFALACGTSFLLYLHRYTWGFVKADVREEFGWSEWQLGLLDGAFGASYGFGQIPAGILCDWFGPHVLLVAIMLLWSISMGGVAVAQGFASMTAARIVFGLTQAGCYPTLSKVTKLWFPLNVRTTVQGWVATFFGRGGGAASFVLFGTVLLGWFELEWRLAIAVLTALGVVFAAVFAFLFRNTPADHPWANSAETALITAGNPDAARATRTALRWSLVLKSGNMRVFFLQQFTSAYADNVYVYWIPLFLLTAKSVETTGAGWMAAVPLLGGAVGGMLGGMLQNWLIVRTGNRRWSRSLIGLTGKMLATILMFVSLGFEGAVTIVCLFALVKFFGDWSQPTVWGTVTDVAGRNAASVFGAVNTVGSIASFVAGPTMGLVIMSFSRTVEVDGERIPLVSAAEPATSQAQLPNMNVEASTLAGSVYLDSLAAYSFQESTDGEMDVRPHDATRDVPTPPQIRIDRVRGRMRIEWDAPSGAGHVVVSYRYVDYASGWSALFVVLGLVYLVSSLSWLWIDCTQPLEEPDAQ